MTEEKNEFVKRTQDLAIESDKRIKSITEKIIDILIKENVSIKEFPIITTAILGRLNKVIDNSTINIILNL
jgi:hypothetical protein